MFQTTICGECRKVKADELKLKVHMLSNDAGKRVELQKKIAFKMVDPVLTKKQSRKKKRLKALRPQSLMGSVLRRRYSRLLAIHGKG